MTRGTSQEITGLSVVIPHHGDPTPTLRLLEQLPAQRCPVPLEFVVVDDASPTPLPTPPGFTVVRRERNGGFGAAVNSGVQHATQDALLVLNSDVDLPADFLAELLQAAQPWWPAVLAPRVRQPTYELIVARTWPRATQNAVEWLTPLARFHGRDWLERRIGNDVTAHAQSQPALTDWLVGVCLLLPTADVRAVGGFDERFFMNCEEIDLQRRLHQERGLAAVSLPGPVLNHRGGGSSDPARRSGWLVDARFRYHQKWHGGPGLLAALWAATLVNLGWNSGRRLTGVQIDPLAVFRQQRRLIRQGWRGRRPAGGDDDGQEAG